MATFVGKLYGKFVAILAIPIVGAEFFREDCGREYGLGLLGKLRLLARMILNSRKIPSATNFLEHLTMAVRILKLPRTLDGAVVECGCFKGCSTANLSLVCALTGRHLEVFDSFEGLPLPADDDKVHCTLTGEGPVAYKAGDYRGTLEEVKANIRRYGQIECCRFHGGYFEESLPEFREKIAFLFLDVDLCSSLHTCLRHLWPQLREGCCLFTHEARDGEFAKLFFDRQWWQENLKHDAPGLLGAGTGLGLLPAPGGFISDIGYIIKDGKAE